MFRVKVYGPSTSSVFGCDIHDIEGPASVRDVDGVLIVTTKPYPGRPAQEPDPSRPSVVVPRRRATRGSQVAYPRGGWTKAIVTDYVEDEES